MTKRIDIAQVDDDANVPRRTIENRTAPANARESLIAGGQRIEVPGANIVTFEEDRSLDFARLEHWDINRKYVYPRRNAKKQVAETLIEAQEVVDMVVIHSDITVNSKSCFNVLKSRGFSTHFMIDWDGTIYQATDASKKAIHAASDYIEDVNNRAIGIDINCLQNNYARSPEAEARDRGTLASQFAQHGERRTSETVEINGVPWKSFGYTDLQYDAIIKLLAALSKAFPKLKMAAPIDERGEVLWQVPAEFDLERIGIYGHMHLTAQKFDPGPGFDWGRVLQGLSQEHNSFPVDLVTGRTIANLLTEEKVKEVANLYYRNTEASELGGYYPIGKGGQWHGGVHLHVTEGSPVRAMFKGTVVAARNGEAVHGTGSNNFVVLRHEVPFDPRDETRVFVFFTLYMHLRKFDQNMHKPLTRDQAIDPDTAPEWVTAAGRIDTGKDDEAAEVAAEPDPDKKSKGSASKNGKGKNGKGKNGKGKNAGRAGDEGGDDDDADARSDDEVAGDDDSERGLLFRRGAKPYLDVGNHLASLARGDVALFDIHGKEQTRVSAGDLIGRIGTWGEEAESADDGVLHVELFADDSWRQIVDLLGTHGEHWVELEADVDDNLTVDTDDLVRVIMPDAMGRQRHTLDDYAFSARSVTSDDIMDFYARDVGDDAQKLWVRKSISRHVSEWSDGVDWFKSMVSAEGWSDRVDELTKVLQDDQGAWVRTLFARELYRHLPFIWLNQAVAEHIGLQFGKVWDGRLTYFHPIHFLMWMTFHTNTRLRVLSKGRSKAQLKALRAKERKNAEERRQRGEIPEDFDHDADFEIDDVSDLRDPAQALEELWGAPPQPGDWRRRD
jgi:N-acetyl-anhydromuramyl-L-alanine amidase AmpD